MICGLHYKKSPLLKLMIKKGEYIMPVIVKEGNLHQRVGAVEYKMPREMAKELLKNRKGTDIKMNPNDYLCKVVNESFGLLRHCDNVIQY